MASESNEFPILDLVYWDRLGIGGGGGRMLAKYRFEIGFKIADAIGAVKGFIPSNKKLGFNLIAYWARGRLKGLRCLVCWFELFGRFKFDHFYTLLSVVITK
jgi:hypothetical protein